MVNIQTHVLTNSRRKPESGELGLDKVGSGQVAGPYSVEPDRQQAERVYHYTVGVHLESIMAEGVLRPATLDLAKGERPVTWFSSSQTYEPTAIKLIQLKGRARQMTLEEQRSRFGAVRLSSQMGPGERLRK